MKFLLRLKHWQIFGITWGLPILINIISTFYNPILVVWTFPILMILFIIGTFGWIWAIVVHLNSNLPDKATLSLTKFKFLYSIPLAYMIVIISVMGFASSGVGNDLSFLNTTLISGTIVFVHLLSMVIIFWGISFAAKTIKSIELGRMAKFSDYAGEFFLIWFSIIGYWFLQPRLNELYKSS